MKSIFFVRTTREPLTSQMCESVSHESKRTCQQSNNDLWAKNLETLLRNGSRAARDNMTLRGSDRVCFETWSDLVRWHNELAGNQWVFAEQKCYNYSKFTICCWALKKRRWMGLRFCDVFVMFPLGAVMFFYSSVRNEGSRNSAFSLILEANDWRSC